MLLVLAFAPFGQFYLAWVALAPWLIAVARVGSLRSAFVWGWVGGAAFFGAQFSYVLLITPSGRRKDELEADDLLEIPIALDSAAPGPAGSTG